ncbi:class I SAM-dependent methyltransferase [Oceanispirochaeta sp.]|jgi:hypothetical protein|uniref:class I SAM-dependent methyltransferase n=1 Tax=Oceanispirochaeta sp. TaxID=2035350 RepID=UPI002620215F|nr:class I SAM-dependent methyltransferase [Oceanispirochaeta sp.]MDA3956160.1 class I SAM-dependent methyltransferase [Oceanispirochaeta sp.]
MSENKSRDCLLCGSADVREYFRDRNRNYLICQVCSLVFVPVEYHLSESEEKSIYDLHQNDPYDPGYRRFLSRLSIPLIKRIKPGSQGLDFGCGPGPALCVMLEEKGMTMTKFDKFYFPDASVLKQQYDFICSTEVIEHLRDPSAVFTTLFYLLKKQGTLAVMTKMVLNRDAFSKWHYIQDQSHICFYSRETMHFLAAAQDATLQFMDKDVIFFHKDRFLQ